MKLIALYRNYIIKASKSLSFLGKIWVAKWVYKIHILSCLYEATPHGDKVHKYKVLLTTAFHRCNPLYMEVDVPAAIKHDIQCAKASFSLRQEGNSTRCGMTFTHKNPLSFGCKTQRFVDFTPHFTTLFDNSD